MAEEGGPGGSVGRSPDAGAREDRSLPMPELPLMEEPLGSPGFRLRRSAPPVTGRRFVVAGRRSYVAGDEAAGVEEVWAHPLKLAGGIRLPGLEAERVTVTPVGVERRLRAGRTVVLERVVVPREAPVALLEWESRTASVDLSLEWRCDLGTAAAAAADAPTALRPLRWRRAGRGVVVAGPGDERAIFGFSDRPSRLEVAPEETGGLRFRAAFRLHPHGSVRMAVAGGSGEPLLARATRVADRTVAAVRSAQAHAEQVMAEGLALDAPDTGPVQALEWAKLRLGSFVAESPGVGRSLLDGYQGVPHHVTADAVWGALAAVAAGDARTCRDTLTFLGRRQAPDGRIPVSCSTRGDATYGGGWPAVLYMLLTARYHAWTGDTATLQAEWPRVLRAYEVCLAGTPAGPAPGPPGGSGIQGADLRGAALRELATAAESIGDRGAAVEVGRAAEAAPSSPDSAGRAAFRPPPTVVVGGGLASGTRLADAAAVVLTLVHGLLGAEADAARGRLVLRPTPPADWSRFAVRNLRAGEATIVLAYRRHGAVHTFRLQQDGGGIPVRLILEPALPGTALRAARVDGAAAALDARVEEGRVVVPLQVVLDHARVVELELEPGVAG